ncbi:MAG TPA: pitrilysin family protein [Candidatus Saccharimonadales bacterium]|jgi:zinc protease|nr:pitrilysin family protein [Candidatus Saccharimonadales bacterium]
MATRPAAEIHTAVPPLTSERQVTWPKRTRARLANGLEVVLAESHTIPKFHGELFLRSGNAAASHRGPGLAEMTATVVRTGTAKRPSRQIEEDLRRLGADLSSHAGADNSAIAFAGLSELAEPLLQLVNELAREAAFPEPEFERERRQKLEEVKLDRTQPGFLAGERLRKVLFGAHPYGQVAPTEEQVAAYKRDDLLAVYRDFYTPENALLLMVGDFDSAAMLKTVEKVFGAWSGKKPIVPPAPEPAKPRGRRVHLVHVPGAVQAQILAGCHAITRRHPDWIRLGLTNSLYGGAFNSRLVMNIREDKGYTYSPRSSVNPLRQNGYFSISAAVRNDVVAASLTEIFYELDKLRALPVPDPELADARNYVSGVFSLGLATQDGLLSQLATVALNELPDDYLETYREKVRALTPDDLLGTARRYLDSANMQIVVVGDRTQIEPQAALFGDLDVYDAHGKRLR